LWPALPLVQKTLWIPLQKPGQQPWKQQNIWWKQTEIELKSGDK
jgi:hypothetical protein